MIQPWSRWQGTWVRWNYENLEADPIVQPSALAARVENLLAGLQLRLWWVLSGLGLVCYEPGTVLSFRPVNPVREWRRRVAPPHAPGWWNDRAGRPTYWRFTSPLHSHWWVRLWRGWR